MKVLSKIESVTRRYLRNIVTEYKPIYNYRPDFLKNPETGRNLEIDIYYPDLKIGVEVNGRHHQLRKQKKRDELKNRLCQENGISLVTVSTAKQIINLWKAFPFLKSRPKVPHSVVKNVMRLTAKSYTNQKKKDKKFEKALKWDKIYEAAEKEKEFNRRKMIAKGIIKLQ